MNKTQEALKLALDALEPRPGMPNPEYESLMQCAIAAIREALAEQPVQQQDEDAQCRCESSDWIPPDDYDGDGSVSAMARRTAQKQEPRGWQWLDTGVFRKKLPKTAEPNAWHALYTSPPASKPNDCARSHPHENMDAMCELRTEIARLTNENARLKARHQDDEINAYRMTLLCIRDGLQQGMSKSIQKLQAREINDVLGLPSFASYRTSPPASKPWVGLTDEEIDTWNIVGHESLREFVRAIEAKLRSKNA